MGPKLWVRENLYRGATHSAWCYAADQKLICLDAGDQRVAMMVGWAHHYDHEKAPAIHMCRWASRLTLMVTDVRVQRLQQISDADCIAEGCRWQSCDHPDCQPQGHDSPRGSFYEVWRDLHGHDSWAADPEVVALTFTVHQRNIDEKAA